ncbi:probable galactose-1-phosphate uridylyltransferase [Galendromus occidentalis]|uniref:Galactose-1-phosphate uridylyltransferase n=1 Tax=Galendromus occidentalis TaxID=34638 RepID=A0AAJ6W025_9ACAR|nr:probable galactose-1-phosphate uridylyltransferase [Galendromus occidentalis]
MAFDANKHPHTRYNPLRDEWVLVSPQRTQRPWLGEKADQKKADVPLNNPLSPGAVRPNGQLNPEYKGTWWFINDFPALLEDCPLPPTDDGDDNELFRMGTGRGRCEVLCFHPDPSLTLAKMSLADIETVINAWTERYAELSKTFEWVMLFENRGAIMGSSNPHPHGQIWSSMYLPNEPRIKDRCQRAYFEKHGRPLLVDYLQRELAKDERIVCQNENFVVLVPFWAIWPYETMLLPKRHVQEITDLTSVERKDLARIMKELLIKYDNLFETEFPYSMGWHGYKGEHWQLHALYLPPLLRSATIKKHQVGYELLAQAQRDISPETAAQILRDLDGGTRFENREEVAK